MAMHALQSSDVICCASLLFGYYAFLRTGEFVSIRAAQCITDTNGHLICISASASQAREEDNRNIQSWTIRPFVLF